MSNNKKVLLPRAIMINNPNLGEDFVDLSLVEVKTELSERSVNDTINDPLMFEASKNNVKLEPAHTSPERKFYGRIALEVDVSGLRNYKFICDKCTKSFPNLESFDDHISKNYLNTNEVRFDRQNQALLTENDKIKEEIQERVKRDDRQCATTSQNSEKSKMNYEEDDSDYDNMLELDGSEDAYETFEPKAKKLKSTCNRSKTLSFEYPDKNYVTFFLELLKSHAILWLKRHSTKKPFTEASNNLIQEFNAKFPNYILKKQNLQKTIDGIKSAFEQAKSDKNGDEKYCEYLKICAEIDKNSKEIEKKCDLCKAVFYCSKDLQIHKFKSHKVGELPYKCQRCGYGFAAAEALASHEEKHNRVKSFECELCGLGFYSENKLLAHRDFAHSKDRKPVCEICGTISADATRYRQHKRTHEPKKEKCSICGKCFLEKWQLLDHMKAHQNERTYVCNLCGKGFNRQKNLYIHKMGVHKIKGRNKAGDSNNRTKEMMT